MSKAVLISIQPKWCENIANGIKTVEVRKTKPKLETPFKCYIYETKTPLRWNDAHDAVIGGRGGKVIGEFVCDKVEEFTANCRTAHLIQTERIARASNLGMEALVEYGFKSPHLYGWRISNLVIYDTPKQLSEFAPVCKFKQEDGTCPTRLVACSYQHVDYNPDGNINLVECGRRITRPPQSWCYVEELAGGADHA